MFDAAAKALAQMFTPPFRAVLLKSILLALVFIALFGFGLFRLLSWLAGEGGVWAEGALGPATHIPLSILLWMFSIAASFGIIFGSVFLMPAVTSFVASFFVDEIAGLVEREHYPADPPGQEVPLPRAIWEGVKTALLSIAVYLCAVPFVFVGIGFIIFFLAAAFLISREYFELAAMRFHPPAEAKRLRHAHRGSVFAAGLLIALVVSIPIVNLVTPLFGMAMMVHLHKKLAGRRLEAITAAR